MGNTSELSNKAFADKFIRDNYFELSTKFRLVNNLISEKGVSSLDELNDTCLGLYKLPAEYEDYIEFEEIANKKFRNAILKVKKKNDAPKYNKRLKLPHKQKDDYE